MFLLKSWWGRTGQAEVIAYLLFVYPYLMLFSHFNLPTVYLHFLYDPSRKCKFPDNMDHDCLFHCSISEHSTLSPHGSRTSWWQRMCTNHLDLLDAQMHKMGKGPWTLYIPTPRISYQGMMGQLSHGQDVFAIPCTFSFLSSKPSACLLSIILPTHSPSGQGHNTFVKVLTNILPLSYIWNTLKNTDWQCIRLPENLPHLWLLCFPGYLEYLMQCSLPYLLFL